MHFKKFKEIYIYIGLAWIVQWDYIIITDESAAFPSLGRTFKTKQLEGLKGLHDERERREKGERERREKGELQLKIEPKNQRAYK